MKILVVSDSHRHNDNIYWAIEKEGDIDLIIHCGDAEGCEDEIEAVSGCNVEVVLGNNDFFSNLPSERELMISGYKILLTHGHYYYVSMGTERIAAEARARDVDIVMFGHTHKPLVREEEDGLMLVNPGSISYPRQAGREPSYIIMEINKEGEIDFKIKYIK